MKHAAVKRLSGNRQELAGRLTDGCLTDNAPSGRMPPHQPIARSIAFMTQNYCLPIQLKDLVKVSGMSRRGFIKAFNKHTGWTPGAALRQMRIEHAKHLLLTEDLSLSQIARHAGFSSANTFCVAFQRAEGIAPKKFQRSAWLAACRQAGQFMTRPAGESRRPGPGTFQFDGYLDANRRMASV
jgi:AraC-like DNA-binding protein